MLSSAALTFIINACLLLNPLERPGMVTVHATYPSLSPRSWAQLHYQLSNKGKSVGKKILNFKPAKVHLSILSKCIKTAHHHMLLLW